MRLAWSEYASFYGNSSECAKKVEILKWVHLILPNIKWVHLVCTLLGGHFCALSNVLGGYGLWDNYFIWADIRIFEFNPITTAITQLSPSERVRYHAHSAHPSSSSLYMIVYYRPTQRSHTGVVGDLMTQGRQRSLSQSDRLREGETSKKQFYRACSRIHSARAPLTRIIIINIYFILLLYKYINININNIGT